MKTLVTITFCFFLCSGSIFAQSSQYAPAMKENLEKMSKWSEPPQSLSSTFERIAQAEQNQWLPYYYAAYATVIQSFGQQDVQLKDKTIDHAQSLLDATITLHPDSSEIMVLQGYIYIARLQADPMARGAEFSQKANEAFDMAIKLNPENPRGYYMKGLTVLHTPDFYGGGKVPAKPILAQAITKFDTFKPLSQFSPDWGKNDCQKNYASCQ
jgi:hypothetical protein